MSQIETAAPPHPAATQENASPLLAAELQAHDPEAIAKYEGRFSADATVIPELYKEYGIGLNWALNTTLEGEYRENAHTTHGLALASMDVGRVINKVNTAVSLFDDRTLATEIVVADDGWHDEKPVLPPKDVLGGIARLQMAGESGQMLAGLIADASYPYEKQPHDGLVELSPRPPKEAYNLSGRYGQPVSDETRALLCSNTEQHFAVQGFSSPEMRKITIGDETVALQKSYGDHTAILVKPALLNGVRIPAGSIMLVDEQNGQPQFAFGRLSLFNFDSPEEAARQMPDIVKKEFQRHDVRSNFETSVQAFNSMVGRDVQTPVQTAEKRVRLILDSDPSISLYDAKTQAAREISAELEKDIQTKSIRTQLKMLRVIAFEIATARLNDLATNKANEWKYDSLEYRPALSRVKSSKARLNRTNGIESVRRVYNLIDALELVEAARF